MGSSVNWRDYPKRWIQWEIPDYLLWDSIYIYIYIQYLKGPVLHSQSLILFTTTILSWGRSMGFGFLHTASIELNGSCYAVSTFRQWPLRTNSYDHGPGSKGCSLKHVHNYHGPHSSCVICPCGQFCRNYEIMFEIFTVNLFTESMINYET